MKKSVLFLLASVLLFGCSKDEETHDNYRKSIGIYEKTGEGSSDFQVNLDNGMLVIPEEITGNLASVNDGERVIVYFSTLSETTSENDQKVYNCAIHGIDNILTKDIVNLTDENADSIGNNSIHVHEEDIWISKNFLNVYFSYYGHSVVHHVNMIKYPNDSSDADGRLILEFRHNNNNDYPAYAYDGLVSFDMNSLQTPGIDSLPIVVKVNDFEGDSLIWKDTYYFNDNLLVNKSVRVRSLSVRVE